MIPDWAPGIHPLVIHFPIALVFAAFVVDLTGVLRPKFPGLRTAAVALYAGAAVGAAVAYVTGNQVAGSVMIPGEAVAAVNDHQDWALYTLIFTSAFAALRIALLVVVASPRLALRIPVVLAGVVGLYLIWQTGERGGRLVYDYGVGVRASVALAEELRARRDDELSRAAEDARPVYADDGGWTWRISSGADAAFTEAFEFLEGSPDDVHASVEEIDGEAILALHATGAPVMFVTGGRLYSVDVEAELDLSDFNGAVSLVHNVEDAENYHFLRLRGPRITQGRTVGGTEDALGGGESRADAWTVIRATGDRGHFYAYEDGRTVTHGHSPTPEAGWAGIRIDGSGTMRFRRMEVKSVR